MKKCLIKRRFLYEIVKISLTQLAIVLVFSSIAFALPGKAQKILDIKVSIALDNVSLGNSLLELEKTAQVKFSYNSRALKLSQKVNITANNEALSSVLNRLLLPLNIQYFEVSNRIVLRKNDEIVSGKNSENELVFNATKNAIADITIKGTVTDEKGGKLPGVSIVIKGTTRGTNTNSNGEYSIAIPDNKATLVFSFVGYKSQEITIGALSKIDVTMAESVLDLEEVIVTGYGTTRKADLTGAIVSINSEDLNATVNRNLTLSLQGLVPGLEVNTITNKAGSNQALTIRGENSLSASSAPFIVLDGIPFNGNLNDLNPQDIESINVLKDASSSAIYGARGANGVILITTKRGRTGTPRISYTHTSGVASIAHKVDMQDGPQYIAQLQELRRYRTGILSNPMDVLQSAEIANYQAGIVTDWIDLVYRKGAYTRDDQLSISGGNDKTTYYNSIGYQYQEGLPQNNNFSRFTIRSNITHKPIDWLEIGTNLQFTHSDYGGTIPAIAQSLIMSPYGKVYNKDGSYDFYPVFPQTYNSSPFANIKATNDDIRISGITNAYAVISPVKGLSYRLNLGYQVNGKNNGIYYPKTTMSGLGQNSYGSITNEDNFRATFENILNYKLALGTHSLDFTGLYSQETISASQAYSFGRGFATDGSLYHSLESASVKDVSSGLQEQAIESFMGRVNYDFKKLYYLTLTVRRDGYSGFGANNKYGTFPSAAVAWNISDEQFFNSSFVDRLKLRFSYGLNGNMGIPPYRTLDSFANFPFVFGDNGKTLNGFRNSVIGNPALRWESTTSANLGVDFAFLKNRISGSLELWQSNSNDLLMQQSIPITNGYKSVWNNIGEVANKGIELTLNTANINKGNFQWNSFFNFSANTDEIVSLASGAKQDLANNWIVGERIRINYNFLQDGVWQLGEEAKLAASPQSAEKIGGLKIKDVNGDGKLTNDDRMVQGTPTPMWRAGSTNEFKYNRWTLSVFINANWGSRQDNAMFNPTLWPLDKNSGFPDISYWSPQNPSNKIPSVGYVDPRNLGYYEDASVVRIKDVRLSYNVPIKGIINNLQFSLRCWNLHAFTKNWVGWDPEQPTTGNSAQATDPIPREYSLSMKIDF